MHGKDTSQLVIHIKRLLTGRDQLEEDGVTFLPSRHLDGVKLTAPEGIFDYYSILVNFLDFGTRYGA